MAKRKQKILNSKKPYIVSFLSDYGFKVTFGDKENTLFARKALELIIEDLQPIEELKYLRNEFEGESEGARAGLYDVVCQDEYKRVFVIEMQVDNYANLLKRIQFYAFQMFTAYAKKGKKGFDEMSMVHCICIIKGTVTENPKYHQVVALKNDENEVVMDDITFHLIELGKFSIAKKDHSLITNEKDELFYTMKYAHTFDATKNVFPPFWEKEHFQVSLKRLNTSLMSPVDKALYENMLMRAKTIAENEDKKVKEAEERGAIQKTKKTIQNALLKGKFTIEDIAEMQEVSIEFVKQVKRNMLASQKRRAKKDTDSNKK
jgi:predicted transposase/invertase (TIGR01784 family)